MSDLQSMVNRLASETMAYRDLAVAAAAAEADYKRARGKLLLKAKAAGNSMAAAEAVVEGDDECADLLMARLTSAAIADSQKEMLRSLRATIDAEQTQRADLRAADVAMARGYGGAA